MLLAEEGDWGAKRELEVLRREIAGVGAGAGSGVVGKGETEGR